MLMQRNSVKLQKRMDSKQDVFLNPRPNLSMTRSMLNPLFSLEIGELQLGLVLLIKEVNGFTQVVGLNWNFKIGTEVIQEIGYISHMSHIVS